MEVTCKIRLIVPLSLLISALSDNSLLSSYNQHMPRASLRRNWFLYLTTAWIVTWGFLRFCETTAQSAVYASAGITLPSEYFTATAVVSAAMGVMAIVALVLHDRGRLIALAVIALWLLWSWADFLFLHSNPLTRINWPYQLLITTITLGLAAWQAFRRRRITDEKN